MRFPQKETAFSFIIILFAQNCKKKCHKEGKVCVSVCTGNRCAHFFTTSETVQVQKSKKFRVKPLFSFALRKGKTWSFGLSVGATGIFSKLNASRKPPKLPHSALFSLKQSHRFWGQALQKRACGFQKGKALCLHPEPIFTLFHNFRSLYASALCGE